MAKKKSFPDGKGIATSNDFLELEQFGPLVRNAVTGLTMPKDQALRRLKFLWKEYPSGFQLSVEWIKESKTYSQYWDLLVAEYKGFGKVASEEKKKGELPSFKEADELRTHLKGNKVAVENRITELFYNVFHGEDYETKKEALGKIKFILNNQRSTFLPALEELWKKNALFARKFVEQYPVVKELLKK